MDELTKLADEVRRHVKTQPFGSYGTNPVPIEVLYDGVRWRVRFVIGIRGDLKKRREWASSSGKTILEALQAAREKQLRGY